MSRPGVGLVEHRDPRLQHRHLEDLDALLLAAREAFVEVARRELARDLELLHRGRAAPCGTRGSGSGRRRRRSAPCARVDRRAQEVRHRHARDRVRVLEGEEEAPLRALVGAHLGDVLAVEEDLPLGDLVGRVAHQRVGERGLAGAVRPHHRVHLVRVDGQVDALDDLGSVLGQCDVQVLELKLSQLRAPRFSNKPWNATRIGVRL